MKICFVDPTPIAYDADTPLSRGLSGAQSSLCHLAAALAARGHFVSVVNANKDISVSRGVRFVGERGWSAPFLNFHDVVVALNGALGLYLKGELGVHRPRILWTQHAPDQPAVQELKRPEERESWSGFVFVSRWQAEAFVAAGYASPEKSAVIHNGISPAFAQIAERPPWFLTGAEPLLVYTSTPYRGLDVLLEAFPIIRSAWPTCRLRVYSSMGIAAATDAPYAELYRRCAETPGAEYIGSVGQHRLAEELAGSAVLAYPSTFPETFCVAAVEAAAAGAMIFSTRLGALLEINADFAQLVDFIPDATRLAQAFAAAVINGLEQIAANPGGANARRQAQIADYRVRFDWLRLAAEWETVLARLPGE